MNKDLSTTSTNHQVCCGAWCSCLSFASTTMRVAVCSGRVGSVEIPFMSCWFARRLCSSSSIYMAGACFFIALSPPTLGPRHNLVLRVPRICEALWSELRWWAKAAPGRLVECVRPSTNRARARVGTGTGMRANRLQLRGPALLLMKIAAHLHPAFGCSGPAYARWASGHHSTPPSMV